MNEERRTKDEDQKICLTVAGVDPSGGAGIYADIKTFSAFGCFATAAITSITFQNTQGVFGAEHQTAATVRRQIEPILEDFEISAVKTGMLPSREIIEETARIIGQRELKNPVVDPVVRSTSGYDLIDDAALKVLIEKLFPLALVITPNIPEAERISGIRIERGADIEKAAAIMRDMGARNVLIKGGHLEISDLGFGIADLSDKERAERNMNRRKALDFLFLDGKLRVLEAEYISTEATHGTGCTLAAAITANLALGKDLSEAVEAAKRFVHRAIRTSPRIGKGNSPINQLIVPE